MKDLDCWALLEWAAPRCGLRLEGFRHVVGQVCKRIRRRIAALGLGDVARYRAFLEATPGEWRVFERLCVVTVSRFYRDPPIWEALRDEVLPRVAEAALARGERTLRFWSLGCASGEEPYTLSMAWALELAPRYPALDVKILGTDIDAEVLERARVARYAEAPLRDVPERWKSRAFELGAGLWQVREPFRRCVELRRADVRDGLPSERFDGVCCRNAVFTSFDEAAQRRVLDGLSSRIVAGGVLVMGTGERLPERVGFVPWRVGLPVYRRDAGEPAEPRGFAERPLG